MMAVQICDYSLRLRAIRKREGLTQKQFSEIVGLSQGTVRNYEAGIGKARAEVMERVLRVPLFRKYTLWLIHGSISDLSVQIALPDDGRPLSGMGDAADPH